ncbi:MAG: acyl-ACP thioesterase [Spirochaetaceae bacterium]|jgi:acyl-ACP thioesterase|nr:acyl-ACP thioesterase [Spirochaetaceae bacterium]
MDIWQRRQKIIFNDVDSSGGITLFAAFNYFQDAAESHAEIIGVGREIMRANKQVWVLSRMSAVIQRRPRLDEEIVLRSWPRGFDRLFCVRDYDMRDADGNVLVRARSGWLILDLERRRPLRPQSLAVPIPVNEGLDAMTGSPLGLEPRAGLSKTAERTASYSDIDFNGHMNNARYIQWVQDASDGGSLTNALRMRLDINYIDEVKLGEEMGIWSAPIDDPPLKEGANKTAVEGRKQNGNTPAFRAELLVNER